MDKRSEACVRRDIESLFITCLQCAPGRREFKRGRYLIHVIDRGTVWGALFAYLLLSESLSALGYLGGGLIIASSIVQTQFDLRARAAAVS